MCDENRMKAILVKEFPEPREVFIPRHIPLLGCFYRYAYQAPSNGRAEIWIKRALRKLYPVYRRICGTSFGEFDYCRMECSTRIKFNARNTQFHAVYDLGFENRYEVDVAALLDALLPEGGTFFDIGSNWGYFALYTASNHARLKVFAFEPTPQTYEDLVSCVQQAGLANIVVCHNIALSNADGDAFINIPDHLHSGCARFPKSEVLLKLKSAGWMHSVCLRRIL